jgi:hypothetical protein
MKPGKSLCCLLIVIVLLPACTSTPVTDAFPPVIATIPTSYPTLTPIPSATAKPAATETIFPQPTPTRLISTPELIEEAFDRGEITNEERLLYLAYAVYDPYSLPAKYFGNRAWDATFVVHELHVAAIDPSILCSMSLDAQREIQRLLNPHTTCDS